MHGNNLNSLHQLIHPEILPSELGGMMPPYDMGTWARTLLDHAYDEESDYCPESYTLSVQDLERDLEKNLSPKTMKRSERRLALCPGWLCFRTLQNVSGGTSKFQGSARKYGIQTFFF